jgi:hypothetical protein
MQKVLLLCTINSAFYEWVAQEIDKYDSLLAERQAWFKVKGK